MENKTVFRAHPVYVYKILKRFVFVLILPVVKGLVQYIMYRRISGVLLLEGIALGVVAAISLVRLLTFKITASRDVIVIEDGIFLHKKAEIPINKISSVTTNGHILLDIFGAVGMSINTEVGAHGKKDFDFKLYKSDAAALETLIYGNNPQVEMRFPVREVALLSATATSAVTGLLVGVPILNRVGKLTGIAVSQLLLEKISSFSKAFETYFPPVVNAITLFFIALYVFSFLLSFLRNMFFKICTDNEKLEIKSGFYFRRRRIFRKSSVNDICVEQTPLMSLFGAYTVRVGVGGYGGEKGERSTVIPGCKRARIKKCFSTVFPGIVERKELLRCERTKQQKRRFFFTSFVWLWIILAVTSTLAIIFPSFGRLILFVALVAIGFDAYYARVMLKGYRTGGINIGKTITARGTAGFTVRELYAAKENVGHIRIFRTPADIKYGTCKIKTTVRSESCDSVNVRNVDFKETLSKIKTAYGINE